MDEDLLIRSIQTEDNRNAFAFLVRRYQSSLRGYLRNMCGGRAELADELAQEAFLKAFRGIKSFHGKAKFSTWLFQIARNVYLDRVKRSEVSTCEEAEQAYEAQLDIQLDMAKALKTLPEQERDVLVLNYVEGFSHEEISQITDTPIGTVKSRLLQAKAKLMRVYTEVSHGII